MDYVRPGLVNKPNITVKSGVVAVCDAGGSGGLGRMLRREKWE